MSFSRWSNSLWYTYWESTSSLKRDEQTFTICGVVSFTYKELKENLEVCLEKACLEQSRIYSWVDEEGFLGGHMEPTETFDPDLVPTTEEKEELKGYMKLFITRVENDPEVEL
jgi:hypothetical protein